MVPLQVCYAFFLMLGTVGYRASLMFVRHIYRCGVRCHPAASDPIPCFAVSLLQTISCVGQCGKETDVASLTAERLGKPREPQHSLERRHSGACRGAAWASS